MGVRSAARDFTKTRSGMADCWQRLRTRSGRATKKTLLMGQGVSLAIRMKFARHAKSSIRAHHAFARLTTADVRRYLLVKKSKWPPLFKASVPAPDPETLNPRP